MQLEHYPTLSYCTAPLYRLLHAPQPSLGGLSSPEHAAHARLHVALGAAAPPVRLPGDAQSSEPGESWKLCLHWLERLRKAPRLLVAAGGVHTLAVCWDSLAGCGTVRSCGGAAACVLGPLPSPQVLLTRQPSLASALALTCDPVVDATLPRKAEAPQHLEPAPLSLSLSP